MGIEESWEEETYESSKQEFEVKINKNFGKDMFHERNIDVEDFKINFEDAENKATHNPYEIQSRIEDYEIFGKDMFDTEEKEIRCGEAGKPNFLNFEDEVIKTPETSPKKEIILVAREADKGYKLEQVQNVSQARDGEKVLIVSKENNNISLCSGKNEDGSFKIT